MSKFTNFVRGELVEAIDTDPATTIKIAFDSPFQPPANPVGQRARLILMDDARRPTKFETIAFTGYTTFDDVQTLIGVERGVDGTSAQSWSAGAVVGQDLPAAILQILTAKPAYFDIGAPETLLHGERGIFDSRITFTRNSVAYRWNEHRQLEQVSSNVPRRSYNFDTGRMEWLFEEERTNYQSESEDFSSAQWSTTGGEVAITGGQADPAGGSNAYLMEHVSGLGRLQNTTGTGAYDSTAFAIGDTITVSAFIKNVDSSALEFYIYAVGTSFGIEQQATIGEWTRIFITREVTSDTHGARIQVRALNGSCYVYGVQVEKGELSSYIPASGSFPTRAADDALIDGQPFADMWNASEGTFVAEYSIAAHNDTSQRGVLSVGDGTDSNRAHLRVNTTQEHFAYGKTAGTFQWQIIGGSVSTSAPNRAAYAIAENDVALYAEGSLVGTDSTAAVPLVDSLNIGRGRTISGLSSHLNGHIAALYYYPKRLTNAQLEFVSVVGQELPHSNTLMLGADGLFTYDQISYADVVGKAFREGHLVLRGRSDLPTVPAGDVAMFLDSATNTLNAVWDDGTVRTMAGHEKLLHHDGTFDNRITFTRSTVAHRWTEDKVLEEVAIDTPRHSYNFATGRMEWLFEDSLTNAITAPEDFTAAAWTKTNVVVTANNKASPTGDATADEITETTGTGLHQVVHSERAISANTQYTISVFISRDFIGTRNFGLAPFNASAVGGSATRCVVFDQNGDFVAQTGSGTSLTYKVKKAATYFRVEVSGVTGSSPSIGAFPTIKLFDGTTDSYAGDGSSGLYAWGAQFEQNAVSSYTDGTRAADDAVIDGTDFSDMWNADEGTFVVECTEPVDKSDAPQVVSFDDNSTSNLLNASFVSTDYRVVAINSGSVEADIETTLKSAGAIHRVASGFDSSGIAASFDGGASTEDVTFGVPSINQVSIGGRFDGRYLNGHIAHLYYYPKRLPNYLLEGLSKV